MSLASRFNSLFGKSKAAAAPESPAVEKGPAEEGAATGWESLEKEARGSEPELTFDDLAKEVRFKGRGSVAPAGEEAGGEAKEGRSEAGEEQGGASEAPAEDDETTEDGETEAMSPELKAFRNFFKTDMQVKREMIEAAPTVADEYDEESRMKYVDTAYRTFQGFKHDFLGVARDFGFGDEIKRSTEDFFRRGEEGFMLSDYSVSAVKKLYQQEFTNMRPSFVEKVKDSFVGYAMFSGGLSGVIGEAGTVNELLHAYHSYIMNSDRILQAVPAVDTKENALGYEIRLRGSDSELGRQVFESIPDDLDVGDTEIVSVDEHVMMMVRDRGHALTISSEPDVNDPGKIWVDYNIPKLCNEEMIKALPGLAGYSQNGARGGFVVKREELGKSIADFIGKVPMDKDMPGLERYYGGGAVEVED